MGTDRKVVDSDPELKYFKVQPNKWTFQSKKIRKWVESWIEGRTLNACCGKTKLELENGTIIRNDIDPGIDADIHCDVKEISKHFEERSFDSIVYDPPYSDYQANKHYKGELTIAATAAKREFHKLLKTGGVIIQLGYTTTCMPGTYGYEREEVAVFNTLGAMNDILGTVDRKVNHSILDFQSSSSESLYARSGGDG